MKYSICFSTRTGNTAALAETIRKGIREEDIVWCGAPDVKALSADIIFIGFWTNRGMADDASAGFLKGLREKRIFLFGSAGFGGSEAYFRTVLKRTEEILDPSVEVIGTWMCQGRMPMSVRERYEKMKDMPEKMPNLDKLIENFDSALTHPDGDDFRSLSEAVKPFIGQ